MALSDIDVKQSDVTSRKRAFDEPIDEAGLEVDESPQKNDTNKKNRISNEGTKGGVSNYSPEPDSSESESRKRKEKTVLEYDEIFQYHCPRATRNRFHAW